MLTEQLLADLHKLNRAEKLRVAQLLVNELADEEAKMLTSSVECPVCALRQSGEAAQILYQFLQDSEMQS